MSTHSLLGRLDRELLSELRQKAERITAHVPEEGKPEAVDRLYSIGEAQVRLKAFGHGGIHAS